MSPNEADTLWNALVDGIREGLEEARRRAKEKPRTHVRPVLRFIPGGKSRKGLTA
jgi:hypothetical protein